MKYHLDHRARVVINAGHSSQQVMDGGWHDHSIFTGAILSSPVFRQPCASMYDFFRSVHDKVVQSGKTSQIPTLGKLTGDEGGDIFLALGVAPSKENNIDSQLPNMVGPKMAS